ncbi:putative Permease of the major facilitator superfamily [Thiomonas sp. X19]|uniref:MFS transporter n=1 Tax=Thiomonas sp. X19 TaxID=1050370 RepID=UPI000B6A9B73|nr:MFS transporter [Thiomonas sp. X19]SCC91313.1 putative Permease of the major facilitator superfamily [Thiomonas sp. X19]
MPDTARPNQFALLRQRRFAPFFWTQFGGAGNDNLFKFAFTVMVTYRVESASTLSAGLMVNLIAALYILPFVLFSATSGQLADKFDKAGLMRKVKTLEIAIMLLALWGFVAGNVSALLVCAFGMGLHSTIFGPAKYAYLPQHLNMAELTGGNGMTEMGTFVAILLGNLAGGLLMAFRQGPLLAGLACVAVALLGWTAACFIPATAPVDPQLRINWNPFTETARNLKLAASDRTVLQALLAISWMWFYGVAFLTQFPVFARHVLGGDEAVASLLLAVFSIGIALGSVACEWLARGRVEIGLVPLGAIGMTAFGVDMYFATLNLPHEAALQGVAAFVRDPAHWRVMADLFLLSASAGIYSVPLYALIQQHTPVTHRSRVIAANNIINALYMVVCSGYCAALLVAGVSVPVLLLSVALLNALATAFLLWRQPLYGQRFVAWVSRRAVA